MSQLTQLQVINSRSIGAFVPLLYSACMNMWVICLAELVILLSPFWLSAIVNRYPRSLANDIGPFVICLLFVSVAYSVVLAYKVLFGKQVAWKRRQWVSFEQFIAVQRHWDFAGRIVMGSFALVAAAAVVLWCYAASIQAPSFLDSPSASSSGTGRSFNDGNPIPIN